MSMKSSSLKHVPAVEETGYTQEFDVGKITAEFPACFLFHEMNPPGKQPCPFN